MSLVLAQVKHSIKQSGGKLIVFFSGYSEMICNEQSNIEDDGEKGRALFIRNGM